MTVSPVRPPAPDREPRLTLPVPTRNRLGNGRARAALWLLVVGALAAEQLAHLWVALAR
ncbi:MAG TPA: hypothetical protein VGL93_23845 [Streptosporangiaceae bacterium]|jgi:hypothetical protein